MNTQTQDDIQFAPLVQFKLLREAPIRGERLNAIRTVEQSILNQGLNTPLLVTPCGDHLIVVDGRNRLGALRRLAFSGKHDALIKQIPYRCLENGTVSASDDTTINDSSVPRIASRHVFDPVLFAEVEQMRRSGLSVSECATICEIPLQCAKDLQSLSCVHPAIRDLFFDRQISFQTVLDLAIIPDQKQQLSQLLIEKGTIRQHASPTYSAATASRIPTAA